MKRTRDTGSTDDNVGHGPVGNPDTIDGNRHLFGVHYIAANAERVATVLFYLNMRQVELGFAARHQSQAGAKGCETDGETLSDSASAADHHDYLAVKFASRMRHRFSRSAPRVEGRGDAVLYCHARVSKRCGTLRSEKSVRQTVSTLSQERRMSKEDSIEVTGTVVEKFPSGLFSVQLDQDRTVLAHLAGKLRRNRIRVLAGDRVTLEMSPYDLTKGRITYRHK